MQLLDGLCSISMKQISILLSFACSISKSIFIPSKPGKDIKIKCGAGTELSQDELEVSSTVDGKFVLEAGKPMVLQLRERGSS